jgi:hypothetical protein
MSKGSPQRMFSPAEAATELRIFSGRLLAYSTAHARLVALLKSLLGKPSSFGLFSGRPSLWTPAELRILFGRGSDFFRVSFGLFSETLSLARSQWPAVTAVFGGHRFHPRRRRKTPSPNVISPPTWVLWELWRVRLARSPDRPTRPALPRPDARVQARFRPVEPLLSHLSLLSPSQLRPSSLPLASRTWAVGEGVD